MQLFSKTTLVSQISNSYLLNRAVIVYFPRFLFTLVCVTSFSLICICFFGLFVVVRLVVVVVAVVVIILCFLLVFQRLSGYLIAQAHRGRTRLSGKRHTLFLILQISVRASCVKVQKNAYAPVAPTIMTKRLGTHYVMDLVKHFTGKSLEIQTLARFDVSMFYLTSFSRLIALSEKRQ